MKQLIVFNSSLSILNYDGKMLTLGNSLTT